MRIPIYKVDAFADAPFRGNPAAVCPLETWLDDATLQSIATENNLAATAFVVGKDGRYDIRWMTRAAEVDLCGHATLASAFVLFNGAEKGRDEIVFASRGGPIAVRRQGELLTLDFPSRPPRKIDPLPDLTRALGKPPREMWKAERDHMAVYETEEDVASLHPDMEALRRVEHFAVIATAPGRQVDFVSRFFAPRLGIPEDPATGSAHCTLVPYWSERLGKARLRARQISPRVGELTCEDRGDRVALSGRAVLFLEGQILL
jgi:PhzF family phenazine biosynthesis protein